MNEKMVPIFDSLTHPTINSNWIGERFDGLASIKSLIDGMNESSIKWAFAVGMKNIGDYNEEHYMVLLRPYKDVLFPIAYFDFSVLLDTDIRNYLSHLKKMGYCGIKIHPRISKINLNNEYITEIIKIACELKLVVLFCTYFYDTLNDSYMNNISELIRVLNQVKDYPVILIHGGTVRILELMEVVRANKNLLLDLSLTMCKYEGSSIDLDIKFLFSKFDQRICIGSDHPEITSGKLRERFEFFSRNIEMEKKENIGYKNLMNFYDKVQKGWAL